MQSQTGRNEIPNPFELDPDQRMILDNDDRFARNELYPLSQRMDDEEWWPEEAFPKIGDNGLFGITIPEEFGGAGLDLVAAGLVLHVSGGAVDQLAAPVLQHQHAGDEQRGGAEILAEHDLALLAGLLPAMRGRVE